jgi:hypothetical protein
VDRCVPLSVSSQRLGSTRLVGGEEWTRAAAPHTERGDDGWSADSWRNNDAAPAAAAAATVSTKEEGSATPWWKLLVTGKTNAASSPVVKTAAAAMVAPSAADVGAQAKDAAEWIGANLLSLPLSLSLSLYLSLFSLCLSLSGRMRALPLALETTDEPCTTLVERSGGGG